MTNWEVLDDTCNLSILKNALSVGVYPKVNTTAPIVLSGDPLNPYGVDAVRILHRGIYGNLIPYDDVTINSSQPVSAASFQSQVLAFIAAGCSGSGSDTGIHITSADFSGSDYQNNLLIGKTASVNFDIWSDDGAGSLLKLTDGYTFNSGIGTITTTAGNYFILIYN